MSGQKHKFLAIFLHYAVFWAPGAAMHAHIDPKCHLQPRYLLCPPFDLHCRCSQKIWFIFIFFFILCVILTVFGSYLGTFQKSSFQKNIKNGHKCLGLFIGHNLDWKLGPKYEQTFFKTIIFWISSFWAFLSHFGTFRCDWVSLDASENLTTGPKYLILIPTMTKKIIRRIG